MFKKWLQIIFDHRISLQERMFRVVTGVSMIALIFILPMGRTFMNWLLLAVSLAAIFMITKVSIQKERIITGATAIAVLLLLLFPVSFFTAGGFYSGMPEWFVLCFIYISITQTGRRKAVFFRALYSRDIALLLYILLLSETCGAEYAETFFL